MTFLSTILAVERADVTEWWMAALLVLGFIAFFIGLVTLYYAQNAVLDAAPGPDWNDLVDSIFDTSLGADDMRYAVAEHFATHQLRNGENEFERRGVALNYGISVVAAGVILIFLVTLVLIVRHPSAPASTLLAPGNAPAGSAIVPHP